LAWIVGAICLLTAMALSLLLAKRLAAEVE